MVMLNSYIEMLLLDKQTGVFKELLTTKRAIIEKTFDGKLLAYFQALELYQDGQFEKLRVHVETFLKAAPQGNMKYFANWIFEELYSFLNSQPENIGKAIIQLFVSVLTGQSNPAVALNALSQFK